MSTSRTPWRCRPSATSPSRCPRTRARQRSLPAAPAAPIETRTFYPYDPSLVELGTKCCASLRTGQDGARSRLSGGDSMIVEQRDYHVFTGKLPELLKAYEEEGIAIQQEHLGDLVAAFTTDVGALSTYTSLWRYDSYAEREERRKRLQADERWGPVLARIQPLIHTQQNRILIP